MCAIQHDRELQKARHACRHFRNPKPSILQAIAHTPHTNFCRWYGRAARSCSLRHSCTQSTARRHSRAAVNANPKTLRLLSTKPENSDPQPSTPNPQTLKPSTLNPQPSTLNPQRERYGAHDREYLLLRAELAHVINNLENYIMHQVEGFRPWGFGFRDLGLWLRIRGSWSILEARSRTGFET